MIGCICGRSYVTYVVPFLPQEIIAHHFLAPSALCHVAISFYKRSIVNILLTFFPVFPRFPEKKKTSNGRLVPTPQRTPGPNRRTPRQPLLPAPLPIRLLLVALLRLPQTPPALAWPFPLSSMRRNHGLHLGLPPVPAHHIPHRVSRSSFPNTPKFILARQGRRDPPQSNALAEPTLSGPTQALAHIFP